VSPDSFARRSNGLIPWLNQLVNNMIQYIRSRIGLKLFLAFTTVLVTCSFFVVLVNTFFSHDFRSLVISENESYISDQALTFLSETTRLQAEKSEAIFQKLSAISRSNANKVELLFNFAEPPAHTAPAMLPRLTPDPINRILYNDASAPMMICYWGGSTVPPRVANGINLIAQLAGTFEETTELTFRIMSLFASFLQSLNWICGIQTTMSSQIPAIIRSIKHYGRRCISTTSGMA
jgi:hypothetical protein